MRFFPVRVETLHTDESPEAARESILRAELKFFSCIYSAQEEAAGEFSMIPRFDMISRNSFAPVVAIQVQPGENAGADIQVRAEMLKSVKLVHYVFLCVFAALVLVALYLTRSGAVLAAGFGFLILCVLLLWASDRLFFSLNFRRFLNEFQSECIK